MICPECMDLSLFRILPAGKCKCRKCGAIVKINDLITQKHDIQEDLAQIQEDGY